jgi:hypothetical protein
LLTGVGYRAYMARKKIIDNLSRTMLEETFDVIEFVPAQPRSQKREMVSNKGFDQGRLVKEADLFTRWNSYYLGDYMRGRYKGRNIQFGDVLLRSVVGGQLQDDPEVANTVFAGQWIIVETEKSHPAGLRVRDGVELKRKKNRIETESTAFNKHFNIEAEDKQNAFMLLTPPFMETLISTDKGAGGGLSFYFSGDRVHIAVNSKRDYLQDDYKKTPKDLSKLRGKYEIKIMQVKNILDILFQNEKVF